MLEAFDIDSEQETKEETRITEACIPYSSLQGNSLSDEEKIQCIAQHFRGIMETLGLDLSHPSLAKTPHRIASMYVHETFAGLSPENFPPVSLFPYEPSTDKSQVILIKDIPLRSVCEHHFASISGVCHVAYLPTHSIIGLSKVNRLVRYFSQRPQVQERLTHQIADSLTLLLETDNVAVSIRAEHSCVTARGPRDHGSMTTTSDLRGAFLDDPRYQRQFLEGIR